MEDTGLIIVLRLASTLFAASTFGISLFWPLIVFPALVNTIGFNSQDRFRFWKSYNQRISPINSLLLPLLTITLSLSALFAQSVPFVGGGGEGNIIQVVKTSRKSIFIIAAILTLAHKPYNFTFLVPRRELLIEYDRRRIERFTGASLSPVDSEDEEEEEQVQNRYHSFDEKRGLNGVGTSRLDTDEIIRDLTKFQYGSVLLATLTFLLILVELICV
ncbi:hypothetical protein JCM5350_003595 [Sporobolomyces pararoseus]